MALIRCSECGQTVSDRATACPRCGNPISHAPQADQQQTSGGNVNWLYWLIGALAVLGVILCFTLFGPGNCSGTSNGMTSASVMDSAMVEEVVDSISVVEAVPKGSAAVEEEVGTSSVAEEKPSGRTMHFIVISSSTSLEGAKKKAREIGGLVVKGYAKGATRYRVCIGKYYTKSEAQQELGFAKDNYIESAWILTDRESAIVYQ